ncbi:class I SAM-dependent methyltransferase [Rhizorhapis suberifaciens]|uniref:Putative O-methyltransferase YrrM n=1 Tax=Rhizorhapis suberifaciens TaxID=13656 RepID=A0A840HRT4_9SPHN|nr:class I SAM-dependent methyltransferase [Rhizorhapis suberifaciens]MBB4640298.1 putative O-methyltransferase YrrM [Rhizorhapis suberifaciens]
MTSREATGLLPRNMVEEANPIPRAVSDWLHVLAFGAIGWPWLVRSLSGGRKKDKLTLLKRLELSHDALPNLGSWKADTALLQRIVNLVEANRPANVVELGSGASTLVTARALQLFQGGSLHSYDQHADFVGATGEWLAEHGLGANMHHAPLVPAPGDWPGYWYKLSRLPDVIDMLIIDGPPWSVHPYVRGAAEVLFPRIPPGGVIVLDDAARPGERIVARRWRRNWPDFEFELVRDGTKGTLVGRRLY